METLPPGLAAHKGLRGQVLLELKQHQPLTARALADCHGVSPTAVRRHLKELELEQLVVYRREQRGQGAPTFTYRLTPDGEALFPKRYEEALTAALEFVERHGGREAVARFFAEAFGGEVPGGLPRGAAVPQGRVGARSRAQEPHRGGVQRLRVLGESGSDRS